MSLFIHGALMICFFLLGMYFFKFWKKTKDTLFIYFGLAFLLMSANRIGFLFSSQEVIEAKTWLYLLRLVAFALIIMGIISKNQPTREEETITQPE